MVLAPAEWLVRIKANVLSVKYQATYAFDKLEIIARGKASGQGEHDPALELTINVPDTETNRRAFFVGRKVDIVVTPR